MSEAARNPIKHLCVFLALCTYAQYNQANFNMVWKERKSATNTVSVQVRVIGKTVMESKKECVEC